MKELFRKNVKLLIINHIERLVKMQKQYDGVFIEFHGTEFFIRVCGASDPIMNKPYCEPETIFQLPHDGLDESDALFILKEELENVCISLLDEAVFLAKINYTNY